MMLRGEKANRDKIKILRACKNPKKMAALAFRAGAIETVEVRVYQKTKRGSLAETARYEARCLVDFGLPLSFDESENEAAELTNDLTNPRPKNSAFIIDF